MRELFVWYRVTDEHAEQARAAVESMQRSLVATCPGLLPRLLIRRAPDAQTWMETYARPSAAGGEGVDRAIETTIAAAARPWARLVDGERHVEAFELASPGAGGHPGRERSAR